MPRKRKPQNRASAGRKAPPKEHQFKKGQSGNPGGLPAWVREVREFCGMHSLEMAQMAVRLARRSRSERTRLAAIEAVLDRAGAKPIQPIEVSGPGGGPIPTTSRSLSQLTDAELDQVEQLLATAAARAAGETPQAEG